MKYLGPLKKKQITKSNKDKVATDQEMMEAFVGSLESFISKKISKQHLLTQLKLHTKRYLK